MRPYSYKMRQNNILNLLNCKGFQWPCYFPWEYEPYYLDCALLGHKSTSNSRIVNAFSQSYRKWPVIVKPLKEHENSKSGVHRDCKNFFNSVLDQHKGREVPVNAMVDSHYKANVKKAR